jgi:hypothetical protein
VLALGINVWAIALLLPVIHSGTREAAALWMAAPLVPLVAGVVLLATVARPLRRTLAIVALLFLFPVALVLGLAFGTDLADRDAWGPVGLSAAALSMLAYGALAAEVCARPLALRTSTVQPLPAPSLVVAPKLQTWLRRGVLGTATAGALGAAVIAPSLGSRADLLRAWGDAADEATVLGCIVATGVGALSIAGVLGPRLRALRPAQEVRPGPRIATSLGLASFAAIAYGVLRWLERP